MKTHYIITVYRNMLKEIKLERNFQLDGTAACNKLLKELKKTYANDSSLYQIHVSKGVLKTCWFLGMKMGEGMPTHLESWYLIYMPDSKKWRKVQADELFIKLGKCCK